MSRISLHFDWPVSTMVTACIEILRFENRALGNEGASSAWIKGSIKRTLRWQFRDQFDIGTYKTEMVDFHFEHFKMPAFDRYLSKWFEGSTRRIFDAVVTTIETRDVWPYIRSEMASLPYTKLTTRKLEIVARKLLSGHRRYLLTSFEEAQHIFSAVEDEATDGDLKALCDALDPVKDVEKWWDDVRLWQDEFGL